MSHGSDNMGNRDISAPRGWSAVGLTRSWKPAACVQSTKRKPKNYSFEWDFVGDHAGFVGETVQLT